NGNESAVIRRSYRASLVSIRRGQARRSIRTLPPSVYVELLDGRVPKRVEIRKRSPVAEILTSAKRVGSGAAGAPRMGYRRCYLRPPSDGQSARGAGHS